MSMVWGWLAAHGKKLGVAALGLTLLVPFLNGVVGGGQTTFVAVQAPEATAEATVFVGQDPGPFATCPGQAEVEILRDGVTVYPAVLGEIELDDCQGSIEIPYNRFASKNGQYVARVHLGDEVTDTRFSVQKVVNWVYVRSFPNQTEERTRVEVALSTAKAQPIRSSVFTSGELVIDVYWEDCGDEGPLGAGLGIVNQTQDCQAAHDNVFHETVPVNTSAVTHVIIPWENFESDKYEEDRPAEGSYNVTATFHNAEAKGNDNVPMDPTVYREDPPAPWFEVDYE